MSASLNQSPSPSGNVWSAVADLFGIAGGLWGVLQVCTTPNANGASMVLSNVGDLALILTGGAIVYSLLHNRRQVVISKSMEACHYVVMAAVVLKMSCPIAQVSLSMGLLPFLWTFACFLVIGYFASRLWIELRSRA